MLILEQERLNEIMRNATKNLENVPAGTLRLGRSQGCVQYFHCLPGGSHNGIYLSKKEIELVRMLAQKSYDERILRHTKKRLHQIEQITKDYEENEIESIFYREHPERQKLIVPVEPTYQQQLEEWLAKPFESKGFREGSPVILTNSGIRVRSKSEKILADFFDAAGIAYKYECPLYLEPFGVIYPDFTFLSRITGKEIFWEHEGMMDNPEYARNAVKKIELYQINHIFPGDRLILTFETANSAINTRIIKDLAVKYLL